ncbi:hypothetical protein P5673_002740 [Acropora cervicornis]|uniref:Uncharacterized protein n=1 Tax=Acropora cervicornis TaxID=6130 RepID=A0AAD9R3K8_ACRCE|nr:hypothetical protein P5673_002740 [Acropora cervicornis]
MSLFERKDQFLTAKTKLIQREVNASCLKFLHPLKDFSLPSPLLGCLQRKTSGDFLRLPAGAAQLCGCINLCQSERPDRELAFQLADANSID